QQEQWVHGRARLEQGNCSRLLQCWVAGRSTQRALERILSAESARSDLGNKRVKKAADVGNPLITQRVRWNERGQIGRVPSHTWNRCAMHGAKSELAAQSRIGPFQRASTRRVGVEERNAEACRPVGCTGG